MVRQSRSHRMETESDPDLELELDPAFGGVGGGESLGESLSNDLNANSFEDELNFNDRSIPTTPTFETSASNQSALNGLEGHQQNFGELMGSSGTAGDGFSLADELASAISPRSKKEERRRMQEEYGIEMEEDDDDDEEQEEEEQEDVGRNISGKDSNLTKASGLASSGNGMGTLGSELEFGSNSIQDPTSSAMSSSSSSPSPGPAPTPAKPSTEPTRKSKSSTSSIPSNSNAAALKQKEESKQIQDTKLAEQNEEIYNQHISVLKDSERTCNDFLRRLRGVVETSTISNSFSSAKENGKETGTSEEILEKQSLSVLKTLQDELLKRESQMREWREIEMGFNRHFAENEGVVGGLRGLGGSGGLDDEGEDGVESKGVNGGLGDLGEVGEEEELDEIQDQDQDQDSDSELPRSSKSRQARSAKPSSSQTTSLDLPPLPSSTSPTSTQLLHLTALNSSLLRTFSHLHDQVQVQRAGMSDVGRRLRNLKAVLNQWRGEWEGVERSRKWIEVWEGQNQGEDEKENSGVDGNKIGVGRKPENIKLWTDQQMERFERVLNDAEVRARVLLKPIGNLELDKLVEEGRGLLEKHEQVGVAM